MKIFALILMLPLLSFVTINEKLNECNGFENFVFGTAKESYQNLSFEIEEGNSRLYEAGLNTIQIKDVQFEYIRVTFTHNQLSAIALSTTNASAPVFFKLLTSRYGNPVKDRKHYEWLGKNVRIVYEPYANGKDAAIDFYRR